MSLGDEEGVTTRAHLLAKFQLKATEHYGTYEDSLGRLLAMLVAEVPAGGFMPKSHYDRNIVYVVGSPEDEADKTSTAELVVAEMWEAHLNTALDIPLTLYISSSGGSVEYALAITATVNQIRREGRTVNGHVAGYAFSAACDLLQMCDHRSIEPTGGLMCHEDQWGDDTSSTTAHEDNAKFSRKMERQVFEIVSRRTGKPVTYYQQKVKGHDWYLSATEALEEGLVDEIVAVPPLKAANVKPPRTPRSKRSAMPSAPGLTEGA